MVIFGDWRLCDDGVTRPTLSAKVQDATGTLLAEIFLIDTGADRTVLSADLATKLGIHAGAPSENLALQGVGGKLNFITFKTAIEFTQGDGKPVLIRGELAAFTDPTATDLSILGRDVLSNFDLIFSRRRNEIILLAPHHQYKVESV
jgi:hypothetical protein